MKKFPAVICFGLLLACSRPPVYQQPVTADSPASFGMWRSDLSNSLTPQEWASFDLALQEFKLQIMMSGQATGGEAINAAVREKIDGRKLLEVMQEGIQIRLKRIKADKAELEQAIQTNSRMRIKPGDDEKAKELADFQQSLAKKLAKMTEDVAATETVLKELETKSAEPAK